MNINGNNILITGGYGGIGRALIRKFDSENNNIIVLGRNLEKLNELKREFPRIRIYKIDITEYDKLDSVVARFSDVNILINNAGIQENYSFNDENIKDDKIYNEFEINLFSPVLLTKKFIPVLKNQKNAAIINVTSGLAFVPKESAPVYCASKAGLHIFTKSLRWQLEHTNIKVFEIIPPLVDTNMTKGRGKGKISPETLADEFWGKFMNNRYEMKIGKVKLLSIINRFIPNVAERIMRNGL